MKKNSDENDLGPPFRAVMLSLLIIFVFVLSVMPVSAGDPVTNSEELISNLIEGNDIVLGKDFEVTIDDEKGIEIKNGKTFTLDLNGHEIKINLSPTSKGIKIIDGTKLTVTDTSESGGGKIYSEHSKISPYIFYVKNGTFNVIKGTLESNASKGDCFGEIPGMCETICVKGSKDDDPNFTTKVYIGRDANITGNTQLICIDGYQDYEYNRINVTVDGKLTYTGKNGDAGSCIQVSKYTNNKDTSNSDNVAVITINPTAKLIDKNNEGGLIYCSGYAKWIINGGTFTGNICLTIKSGNFTINDGTFTATGEYHNPRIENLEGSESTGAAVSITDSYNDKYNTYFRNVELTINGGKFISKNQSAIYEGPNNNVSSTSALSDKGIKINGGEFITHNNTLYPIYITNLNTKSVHVTLNGQTPFYPNLNLSAARWEKDANGNWTVTLKDNIKNLKCLDLSKISKENKVTIRGTDHIVKVSKDDKYSFDGWNDGTSDLPASITEFEGGKVYTPIFTYIKQYDTGEEVEDEEPTPTIEPTPIVTPTQNQTVTPTPTQNQTVKPTVKPTPEPKTVVIVETEVKFEDNKVITSITVPEGSSGSITFTQTEEKGMDEWIPESIEDSYSFDLSCDGEINGDSEIHFVMSDTILKSLGLTPEDVCLKHFEDGVWVKLKISYIILDDGTYYYTAITKSFSPFEISFDAKSEEPTVTPTEETPAASPMPVLGLLMGLGAALLVRRK